MAKPIKHKQPICNSIIVKYTVNHYAHNKLFEYFNLTNKSEYQAVQHIIVIAILHNQSTIYNYLQSHSSLLKAQF